MNIFVLVGIILLSDISFFFGLGSIGLSPCNCVYSPLCFSSLDILLAVCDIILGCLLKTLWILWKTLRRLCLRCLLSVCRVFSVEATCFIESVCSFVFDVHIALLTLTCLSFVLTCLFFVYLYCLFFVILYCSFYIVVSVFVVSRHCCSL